jgi:hypothetical protein
MLFQWYYDANKTPMPITYSRPDKLNHADTILYEIDMLRFAAGRLVEGEWRHPRDAWVYLEAFLVHYRNLLEFLGKPNPSNTDLHVTTIWPLVNLAPPATIKEIHAKGTKLWNEYEPRDAQGGGRISQFLQHCTTKRIEFKNWRIDTMNGQIEPLLMEVEKNLRPGNAILKAMPAFEISTMFSASTATATITTAAALDLDSFLKKRTPY